MTTIDEALDAFLAEQEKRLADRTFRSYLKVIELFRLLCMNDYGPSSLTGVRSGDGRRRMKRTTMLPSPVC
ncbi:MAG: hypothetical protein IH943_10425 [Acidobacteria bacterium]|nr:hypothetical protein [Acidobacteriota bacterium]